MRLFNSDKAYFRIQVRSNNLTALLSMTFLCLFVGISSAVAQNYTTMIGTPNFSTDIPVRLGYVDAANGDLHIEIPLGTYAQRGKLTYSARLVYDSRIWEVVNSNAWEPDNVPNETASYQWSGWRLLIDYQESGGAVGYRVTNGVCFDRYGNIIGTSQIFTDFTYTSANGTLHAFPTNMLTKEGSGSGAACQNGASSAAGYATDSTGNYLSITNYSDGDVWNKQGTHVYTGSVNYPEDSNGNFFTPQWQNGYEAFIDTLGRSPVTVSSSGSNIYYSVLNSQGSTSPYTVTTESIPVHTAFGKSGVTEYSGNITVWQSIQLPDGTKYEFTYDSGSTAGHYGELTGVTLPTGGQLSYSYGNFTDASGNENSWLENWSDGSGTWTLSPSASSGVNQVTMKKPSGDQVVYSFNVANAAAAWDTQEEYESSSNTVLKTLSITWNTTSQDKTEETETEPVPGGSISKTTEWSNYDNYGDPGTIAEWKYYSGSLPSSADRVTTISYTNYGAGAPVGLPNSIVVKANGTTVAQTNITYDSGSVSSKMGVEHHDDTNFGTGYTTRGNPTQIQKLVSGSTYLTTSTMAYDETGQMVSVTDSNNNTTSMSYTDNFYNDNDANPPSSYSPSGPTNAYLTQATLPIIGAETFGYYYGSGQLAYSKDQNGQTTYQHYYDDFDRPTESIPPVGWSLVAYPSSTEIDSYLGINDTTPSTSCSSCRHDETVLDGLARNIDSYLVNDPDGETTVATSYDSNGRVSETTYPYRGTANGDDAYAYDALDRVISITHADGTSSSIAYGASVGGTGVNTAQLCSSSTYGLGYPTLITDEAGKERETWTDGFGRTIEVDEPNSSGSLSENTCYVYDANNNLTQVVSPTGQTRSYSYDDLSRVLSAATPESHVGVTQYSTSYSYTSSGSPCSGNPIAVCSRTDPRGITTTYTYDGLNRLTKITYSDSTPTVTYCYDGSNSSCISGGYSSSNGKGRRTAMSDGSGSTGWSYNAVGAIVTEQRTIASITKTISYAYNGDGSIASITYPSGHIVTYTTGDAERSLSAVDSGSSINYALTASYSAAGGLASVIYGRVTGGFNGITESRQYNNRLETTSISASSSNGTALNLAPCYTAFTISSSTCSTSATGNNGSATGIVNGVDSNETLGFSYDTLNRILSAATKAISGNDCWGQNFGPDTVANLTSISVSQCSAGSLNVSSDGYNHLSATGYSYDNAGDMKNDGSYTYTYDAENRITSANSVSYTYDGNGLRVKKSSGTLYWRSISGDVLAESDLQGNITNEYVFFAGRRIAQRTSTGSVYFYYADSVGTIHTITDGTGHACYDATFTPYGQEMLNPNISQTCSSNYKFTGYEYDSETGLYYAKVGYYNPRLGRSMSADPLGGNGSSPQSWNGYAYAVNDPENVGGPESSIQSPAAFTGVQLPIRTNSETSGFVSRSPQGWQLAVQNARGWLAELKADYLQKQAASNPYGSAPDINCQVFGCKSAPVAATIPSEKETFKFGGYTVSAVPYDWNTYYDYHQMGQLMSGASFFSASWDSQVGLGLYTEAISVMEQDNNLAYQIMLQSQLGPTLSNPLQQMNDSPTLWLDPGFPYMDFGLLFGGGGGGAVGQQCGIGGIDPACSL